MSDPQIYDLSAGCVAVVAPDGKPYATIQAMHGLSLALTITEVTKHVMLPTLF